jgi:uncharacterized protein (DUF58 family)
MKRFSRLRQRFHQLAFRPTASGGFWLLTVVALLASAINYGNNLIFALAFILLAVWLQAAWQCRRNLAGLDWQASPCAPVFAGEALRVEGRVGQAGGRPRHDIALGHATALGRAATLGADVRATLTIDLATTRRGEIEFADLALVSRHPLGLWQSRRALPTSRGLAYPAPRGGAPLPAASPRPAHRQAATDDFQGLRAYAPGDSPRRINWRAYGRRGELLINQFDGGEGGQVVWLDWGNCSGDDEERLAQLAAWVIAADHAGSEYGLRLPGASLVPARGRAQRERCLSALALFARQETA